MFRRALLSIATPFLIALVVSLLGINWGLPRATSVTDPYLFGNHAPWTGEQIQKLTGPTEDPNRGADVASHTSADRDLPVVVNASDEDRARIVRRFRLMSYQPDEWNTLKALSEMKPGPGNFDPKLYQYGGLWVYPVGAMLKGAAMLHLIELHADVTWYLDHPEAFGRFYVVARLWSVFWALIGVVAVRAIVRRIVGDSILSQLAGLGFIGMPVVVNMAHEAKPHLGGAVLMLLAVLAASRYVERGTRGSWMLAGALCGAALGMVLTSLPIFLILPAMVLMRPSTWGQKIKVAGGAVAAGLLVYLLTNPYVPFNYIFHRQVLMSNLGNSQAMYHPALTVAGIKNTVYLIAAGTSPILALVGLIAAVALGIRAVQMRGNQDPAEIRRRSTGLLLAIPSIVVLVQSLLVATGKPGEFGRFMLLPDIFLLIEAMVAIGTRWGAGGNRRARLGGRGGPALPQDAHFPETAPSRVRQGGPYGAGSSAEGTRLFGVAPNRRYEEIGVAKSPVSPSTLSRARWSTAAFLLWSVFMCGYAYERAFMQDSGASTSRLIDAAEIQSLNPGGKKSLEVYADPAPYCLPPVDLFDGKIILAPKGEKVSWDATADISIRTENVADDAGWIGLFSATPISWADKPFEVRMKK
jgi:hypothetical protein